MTYTFAGYTPALTCNPGCNNITQLHVLESSGWFAEYKAGLEEEDTECGYMANRLDENCELTGETGTWTPCTQWTYDDSFFKDTLVSDYNLVCGDKWKKGAVGSSYMVGLFIGSYIVGYLSDFLLGRKKTLMISIVVMVMGGAGAALMPNYIGYVSMYVLTTIAGYGIYVIPFVLSVELVSADKKVLASMIINYPFVIGECLMCLVAWLTRDYRMMHLAAYLPLLALLLIFFVVPESPRWLIAKGEVKRAMAELERGARMLGLEKPVLAQELEKLETKDDIIADEVETEQVRFLDLVKSRTMLPVLAVNYINWIVVTLAFYGITMNSVNLSGDMFLNTLFGALTEIPGYTFAILTLNRWGRKPILTFCQLFSGCSCLAAGLIPQDYTTLMTVLNSLGKLGTSAAFAVVYLYSAEMFPTGIRNTTLATCSMVARVGGFLAPHIAALGTSSPKLPFLIFGISTLVGGSTAIFLPETMGRPLPNTLKESEQLVRSQKRFGCC